MAAAQSRLGIDHPLVTVRNHPQALEKYRRLGFSPSPISYHPWGSVTSLMMFPNNFIELIGIDDPTKFGTNSVNGFCFGRQLGGFLDRGEEGVSLVALHSRDADADYADLERGGLHGQGRIDFRRRMTLPDGRHDEAVVSLGLFIDPDLEDASNFICHQHRPELIWVKSWQNHPNGANGIKAITYVTTPGHLESRWMAMYGDAVRRNANVLEVDTGCGILRAVDQATAEQEYKGTGLPSSPTDRPHAVAITLSTRSLSQLTSVLDSNKVPFIGLPGRVLVGPEEAGNVILEFVGDD